MEPELSRAQLKFPVIISKHVERCPICGSRPVIYLNDLEGNMGDVACPNCKNDAKHFSYGYLGYGKTKKKAINAWNEYALKE